MALTPEERQVIEQAKAQGLPREQALSRLAAFRNQSTATEAPNDGAAADLQRGFDQAKSAVSQGVARVGEIETQDRSLVGSLFGKFANGLRTSGEVLGAVGEGAVRALPGGTTAVDTLDKVTGAVAERAAGSNAAQGAQAGFESLPEGVQRTLGDIGGAVSGGAQIAGFAVAPGVTNTIAKSSLKSADDALQKARSAQPTISAKNGFVANAVNSARFNLSDIDPQVETVLKRSTTDEVNTYFQRAEAAKKDPSKSTPLEIAGKKAEEAYDAIDEARINAIKGKKAILADVADEAVPANVIADVRSTAFQRMGDRYGITLNPDGTFAETAGRSAKLDGPDSKLVSEYFSRMQTLGDTPTVQQVDDLVDWAQSQLYKQNKNLSTLESADKAVISDLKQVTGDLNGRLKQEVGGGYGEVNARISELIELQDELSRALGADSRKGGGLMKKLFSPTGGNTRQNFTQIQQLTGIDLFKEATLAKYAMESVGDTRQKSLLQQLDVAVNEAAELDLTKPLSIVKFIRERADMDGQELANELIKRQSSGASQQ